MELSESGIEELRAAVRYKSIRRDFLAKTRSAPAFLKYMTGEIYRTRNRVIEKILRSFVSHGVPLSQLSITYKDRQEQEGWIECFERRIVHFKGEWGPSSYEFKIFPVSKEENPSGDGGHAPSRIIRVD